tara:strand:+ start:74 stop:289 length:216 start_codon:yes stop_codon:yes gene_type:complete
MKRIKHNDLTHYFLRPHSELPQAYLASCEKFFNTFHSVDNEKFKRQAASRKLQASSLEELDPTIDWNKLMR